MEFIAVAYTDTGTSKANNQDSLCLRRAALPGGGEIIMAAVCDGMGGLEKGEVASAAAVRAFGGWFDKSMARLPVICGKDFASVRRQWTDMLADLHRRLIEYSIRERIELGTTATVFLACGDRYLTANIGDSRVYERHNILSKLTSDHSFVARELAEGRISEEEARHHPRRNVLLQCIGAGESAIPDFTEGKLFEDALYLLCSDGFVHELPPAELERELDPNLLNGKEAMGDKLIEITRLCMERGENDNITAVLIRTVRGGEAEKNGSLKKLLGRIRGSNEDETDTVILLETAEITNTKEFIDEN